METYRLLKRIHVGGTLWFLLCAAVLLVFSLRQAGFHWWLIFSISGYSAVLLLFLFAVYLFAIYQGVVRSQTAEEHPLSTSVYYIALYDLAPFLGSLAGFLGVSMHAHPMTILCTVTQGTLAATFLVWTVFDPAIGLIETSLPQSTAHRKARLAQSRRQKEQQKRQNEQLLRHLEDQEKQLQAQWHRAFEPHADEIAALLSRQAPGTERRVVELGAKAWETGGLTCMRYFHTLILERMNAASPPMTVDIISVWWDGIGTWRKPHTLESLYLQPVA